jgi:hypothetical protein
MLTVLSCLSCFWTNQPNCSLGVRYLSPADWAQCNMTFNSDLSSTKTDLNYWYYWYNLQSVQSCITATLGLWAYSRSRHGCYVRIFCDMFCFVSRWIDPPLSYQMSDGFIASLLVMNRKRPEGAFGSTRRKSAGSQTNSSTPYLW